MFGRSLAGVLGFCRQDRRIQSQGLNGLALVLKNTQAQCLADEMQLVSGSYFFFERETLDSNRRIGASLASIEGRMGEYFQS